MTRILVVDDDPIYHRMITRALEPLNLQIETALNGVEGLAKAKESNPGIIITDVMMPEMNGYEFTRLLRREPQFAQTPILVLTGQTELQDKLKSFETGADDHLTKPFQPEELAARVSVLMRRTEAIITSVSRQARQDEGRVIAVHSLRGGTGCTSLAINLGIGLSTIWKTSTLLLDLTMVSGQVALMLNSTLRRTWADLAGYKPDELDIELLESVISKHESGLSFIAAPTFPTDAEMLSAEMLQKALSILREHFDYIIADLAHDFSGVTLTALDAADVILMLAAPEMASIRAVTAALDTYNRLDYSEEKIKLVLNSTFPKFGLPKDKIESALSMPATVAIPYTADRFIESINYGQPVIYNKPNEPISGLLEDFAFYLSKDTHKKTKPASPSDAWKRVYKRYTERRK